MLWIVVMAAVGLALALLAVGLSQAADVLDGAPAAVGGSADRQPPRVRASAS